jgi:hypothetical protein
MSPKVIHNRLKVITVIFFLTYLVSGLLLFDDYGLSWDEPRERSTGLVNLNYVAKVFHVYDPVQYESQQDLHEYRDRYYGSAFQLACCMLERVLGIKDTYFIFLLRHLLTFLIFFTGSVYLYRSMRFLSADRFPSLILTALFVTQPRFFAEQFYNCKDMIFLSVVCVGTFYQLRLIREKRRADVAKAAITAAAAIATRVSGIFLPLLTLIFLLLDVLIRSESRRRLKDIFLYIILTACFTYVFWPVLWSDPLHNFSGALAMLTSFPFNMYSILNGRAISSLDAPWTYIPEWMMATLPEFEIVLFFSALFFVGYRIVKREKLRVKYESMRGELYAFALFIGPLIGVAVLRTNLYDGWRHLYFITAGGFLCIAAFFHFVRSAGSKRKWITIVLYSLSGAQLAINVMNDIQLHPYQNVYFNQFAMRDHRRNYDVDYWGLSFREGLEYILKHDGRDTIKVQYLGTPGAVSFVSLPDKRLYKVADTVAADYFLTTYRGHREDYEGLNCVYNVEAGDTRILSVFRLK